MSSLGDSPLFHFGRAKIRQGARIGATKLSEIALPRGMDHRDALRAWVSPAVFRLWQDTHSDCRLFQSKRAPPSLIGTTWSTTVATTSRSCASHRQHNG